MLLLVFIVFTSIQGEICKCSHMNRFSVSLYFPNIRHFIINSVAHYVCMSQQTKTYTPVCGLEWHKAMDSPHTCFFTETFKFL